MSWVPSTSSARPLSTFRKGTTCLTLHRYSAVPLPSISRSMVISNRIAPSTRSPLNAELVMMRLRISWIRSNIASSPEYASSSMPYSFSAFGVLPPLWSSAAMKPSSFATLSSICSSTVAPCDIVGTAPFADPSRCRTGCHSGRGRNHSGGLLGVCKGGVREHLGPGPRRGRVAWRRADPGCRPCDRAPAGTPGTEVVACTNHALAPAVKSRRARAAGRRRDPRGDLCGGRRGALHAGGAGARAG